MAATYLSKEGFKKMQQNLEYLTRTRRKEITDAIEHARGFGDLKENAEYKAAKEAMGINEIKIKELAEKLTSAVIIDDIDIPDDKVYIGATVYLEDTTSGEEVMYKLVSESEADPMEDKISVSTPIGKALLGHEIEEIVDIQVPAGALQYKIKKITRE